MSIATELALLANTKESLRVAIGLSTSIPFSQYAQYAGGYLVGWNPSELFTNGGRGAWFDTSYLTTLFQNSTGTTPVTAAGDPVGHVADKSWGGNHATQSTSAYRPTYTLDPSGVPVLLGDGVDDALLTPPATFSGSAYINTSYGWYKSFVSEGASVGLPLTWLKEYVAREGVASVADDDRLRSYFATEQKLMIMMARNLVINNLRMFSGGSNTKITAIGNNGVTTEMVLSTNSSTSWNLSAEGLTAPALLVFDNNPALTVFSCNNNQLTGSIPDLSSNPALTHIYCQRNQLTGSIPDISGNTALVEFDVGNNQLTGSIPDISSNAALTVLYCEGNQLTGSIPDLSSNAALTVFSCNNNQLTGSIPDLSSNTALASFLCYRNQLTGSIPDLSSNTVLANFDVGTNQLTGSIPDLSSNTALTVFWCNANKLTGSIPDLSSNTALTVFSCNNNQLTGWDGGSVSNTLGNFRADVNLLPQSAVDGLLVAFDEAGRASGALNLSGGTNSTPSATGKAAADNLRAKGWTVTLNGY